MNKYVYDADVAILIGHVQGNPYGGYSGGYKHWPPGSRTGVRSLRIMSIPSCTGLISRRSAGHSLMRDKFNQISMTMEERMGKKFFCCDAVLDTQSRQIAIFSGYAKK